MIVNCKKIVNFLLEFSGKLRIVLYTQIPIFNFLIINN